MENEIDFLAAMFQETSDPQTDSDQQLDSTEEGDAPIVTTQNNDDASDDSTPSGDPQIQAYVEFLKTNNLIEIPEDLEFSGDATELETIFNYTKQRQAEKAAEELGNMLPEDFKSVLEYVQNGGQDVRGFLERHAVDPLMDVDLTTEDGQKAAIFLALKRTSNYSDERINKIVERLAESPEDLAEEANMSYQELQQLRQTEQANEINRLKEKERTDRLAMEEKTQALHNAIDTSQYVHPQRRNKVKAFFFEPINTPQGTSTGFNQAISSILTNPEHQAQLADLLLEYDPNTGFSLDRIERKVKTKATQQFQEAVSRILDPKQAQKASNKPPQVVNDDTILRNL